MQAPFNIFSRGPMNRKLTLTVFVAAAVLAAGCASTLTSNNPATVADGVLVGTNGMTLYTFDKDAAGSGKSVCNGPCAQNWPPLVAAAHSAASSDWVVIARDDGTNQWAYKGKPVYFWAKDKKPGDRTGDGVNGTWRVAKP